MFHRSHFALCAIALSLVAMSSSARAEEQPAQGASRFSVGARVGANFNMLSPPEDPAGEPTLLYGSSITGLGFMAGVSAAYQVSSLANATSVWSVRAGALYGRHSGIGYARNEGNNQQQALTLTSHVLHVPVLVEFERRLAGVDLRVGLGPELLWTLASAATVEYTNIDTPPPSLETSDPFHIGLTATAGAVFDVGAQRMPVMVRATWDPQVPGNTRERLLGYVDDQDFGALQAAFDWQFALVVGLDF